MTSGWIDLTEARAAADDAAKTVEHVPHLTTAYIVGAILAVRLELRALALSLEHALEARS